MTRANQYYLQDTRQYVGNSMLWWAIDGKGYVCDIRRAHVFTFKEAMAERKYSKHFRIWKKSYIDQRISHHIDMQHCDYRFARAKTSKEEK